MYLLKYSYILLLIIIVKSYKAHAYISLMHLDELKSACTGIQTVILKLDGWVLNDLAGLIILK